jgi:hypothetical protein
LPSKQAEQLKEEDARKKKELQDFIGPLVDVYDMRAQALIGSIAPAEVDTHLRKAIARYRDQGYRLSRDFRAWEMRTRAAVSITWLLALRGLDPKLKSDAALTVGVEFAVSLNADLVAGTAAELRRLCMTWAWKVD